MMDERTQRTPMTWVPVDEQGRVAPRDLAHCEELIAGLLSDIARINVALSDPDLERSLYEWNKMRRARNAKGHFLAQLKEWRAIRFRQQQNIASKVLAAQRATLIPSSPGSDELLREAYGMLRALQKAGIFVPDEEQQSRLDVMGAHIKVLFAKPPRTLT